MCVERQNSVYEHAIYKIFIMNLFLMQLDLAAGEVYDLCNSRVIASGY